MNKLREKWYLGDSRYEKVLEQMQLLGIQDVTTMRQHKNGTVTWRLPIKNEWNNGSFIEVASFKSGYVRNNNSASSNYQLNKRCEGEPEYFPVWEWKDLGDGEETHVKTDKYRKFTTRTCKLIPIEIDRLEYLISYCLKNYYIKHANFVADGEYIPKWRYDNLADAARLDYDCGHYDKIRDLEEKLENMTEARDCYKDKYKKLDDFYESSKVFNDSMYEGRNDRVKDLENKLDTIQRISRYGETE